MRLRSALAALLLALSAPVGLAQTSRNEPLDFAYRVQGDGRIAPLVFSDGHDIYIQPDRSQLGELAVLDAPFVQEGPYLVVKGLRSRFTLAWKGAMTTVNYAPAAKAPAQPSPPAVLDPAATPLCKPSVEVLETRYPVVFRPRSARLSAAFLDKLPAILTEAKTADAITIVARPDVSSVQFAQRRAKTVRAALVAQGVPEARIRVEARSHPENGSELVISRSQETNCPAESREAGIAAASEATERLDHASVISGSVARPAPAAVDAKLAAAAATGKLDGAAPMALDPAVAAALAEDPGYSAPVSDEDRRKAIAQVIALVQAGKITERMGAQLILAANRATPGDAAMPQALMTGAVRPGLPATHASATVSSATLTFLPNSSVRRVLRAWLRDRGVDLDWQVQGDLIVEEFAAIAGGDMKDVVQTALRRLGLKGTLVAGRLLIVERPS